MGWRSFVSSGKWEHGTFPVLSVCCGGSAGCTSSSKIPDPGWHLGPGSVVPAARGLQELAQDGCGQGQCPSWPHQWASALVCAKGAAGC